VIPDISDGAVLGQRPRLARRPQFADQHVDLEPERADVQRRVGAVLASDDEGAATDAVHGPQRRLRAGKRNRLRHHDVRIQLPVPRHQFVDAILRRPACAKPLIQRRTEVCGEIVAVERDPRLVAERFHHGDHSRPWINQGHIEVEADGYRHAATLAVVRIYRMGRSS
jgi:hypothetical protein